MGRARRPVTRQPLARWCTVNWSRSHARTPCESLEITAHSLFVFNQFICEIYTHLAL